MTVKWKPFQEGQYVILLDFLKAHADLPVPSIHTYEGGVDGTVDLLTSNEFQTFLAWDDGCLVGVVAYCEDSEVKNGAFIYLVLINPWYAGRLLRSYLKAMLPQMMVDGYTTVRCYSGIYNYPAVNFHARIGRITGYTHDAGGNMLMEFQAPLIKLLRRFKICQNS